MHQIPLKNVPLDTSARGSEDDVVVARGDAGVAAARVCAIAATFKGFHSQKNLCLPLQLLFHSHEYCFKH